MTCEGCVQDISNTLYKLNGISKVDADLKEQLVRIEGTGTTSSYDSSFDFGSGPSFSYAYIMYDIKSCCSSDGAPSRVEGETSFSLTPAQQHRRVLARRGGEKESADTRMINSRKIESIWRTPRLPIRALLTIVTLITSAAVRHRSCHRGHRQRRDTERVRLIKQ